MKKTLEKILIIGLSIIVLFDNQMLTAQNHVQLKKIVIDAGHGGTDPGCLGKKSKEKDINLNIALKVGKLIEKHYDDVKVIYTRKTDVAVELYKRAEIANSNNADLFISIHCNAAENRSVSGIETFVMGLSKSEANMAVAKKENAAILKEKNYENNYEGFDPNSPEAGIIFSLYTSAYLKNSALLASKVQRNLINHTHLIDRKVQQAGFWVLYKVTMPSILVECGFLSNATEEIFLLHPENQEIIAISIYNAFVEYKNSLEGINKELLPLKTNSRVELQKTTAVQGADTNENQKIKNEEIPQETSAYIRPLKEKDKNKKKDQLKEEGTVQTEKQTVVYRIQVASGTQKLPLSDAQFKGLNDVKVFSENNMWKYTCEEENDYEAILPLLKNVKNKFADAFVVAFLNGKKISISEAQALQKK